MVDEKNVFQIKLKIIEYDKVIRHYINKEGYFHFLKIFYNYYPVNRIDDLS